MTLKEMQACAAETLDYFIEVMPEAPFAKDDIVVEFVLKGKMAERAKALCAQYGIERIMTASQEADLEKNSFANALIGKEKSAIIVRINHTMTAADLRTDMFHEYMHVFCAKLEMKGKQHFIDIYGTGTTTGEVGSAEDGLLSSGYAIWAEFIAQYYALIFTQEKKPLEEVSDYINHLIEDISPSNLSSKNCLAMACAYFVACSDADEETALFREELDDMDSLAQQAFFTCLFHLFDKLQTEKPWEITEGFVSELGFKYTMLLMAVAFG